jgi:hypothetical protein
MKVGDKVIVTKNNWYTDPILGRIKRKGTIVQVLQDYGKPVYRVYFYDEEGKYKDGCNVFTYQGETIELDIQETREVKLKELGI